MKTKHFSSREVSFADRHNEKSSFQLSRTHFCWQVQWKLNISARNALASSSCEMHEGLQADLKKLTRKEVFQRLVPSGSSKDRKARLLRHLWGGRAAVGGGFRVQDKGLMGGTTRSKANLIKKQLFVIKNWCVLFQARFEFWWGDRHNEKSENQLPRAHFCWQVQWKLNISSLESSF